MTLLFFLAGLLVGASFTVALGVRASPQEPRTDTEHAENVHRKAVDLNLALHDARAAGLNPAIKISPLDKAVMPGVRPLRVTVERNGETVPRSER